MPVSKELSARTTVLILAAVVVSYRGGSVRMGRPKARDLRKGVIAVTLLVAASVALPVTSTRQQDSGTRRVIRVVDGDTLVLDGGERVRLIGVDTPETVHPTKPVERFGKQASAFTRRQAEGQRVELEYDPANAHLGHTDRYGRTLAYVFLADGTFLNAEIVKQGYGHAYTRFPFRYADEFRRHEREAREARLGLWGRP